MEVTTNKERQGSLSAVEIEAWLVERLQGVVGADSEVDVEAPFDVLGVDSAEAVSIVGDLELWLGRDLDPTLVYSYPTIAALADHLSGVAGAHTRRRVEPGAPPVNEPIAVVALGCRLPRAESPAQLWELLATGADAISEVPAERWDPEEVAAKAGVDPDRIRHGGFLDRVDTFDPDFFGISPFEAARMDPQQRLILEVAWEALEDAAIPADSLRGEQVGVWVGVSTGDYGHLQLAGDYGSSRYVSTGTALSIVANRLSYVLDAHGPSVVVDTACSSSLVAVHLACQSLRLGEVDTALVGGVNMILAPQVTVAMASLGALSPHGRCRAFDAGADGLVRGEGAGMVALKRLSAATAAGDRPVAVIRGSAVNNDGRTNGLTAPNGRSQEEVIRTALASSRVRPAALQYVEAHGAGTQLGDPIEAAALGRVLAVDRPLGDLCGLGSVKTNFGHLEAAAGMAGLLKVCLAIERRLIPPSLHFENPNQHIPFDLLPLKVQTELGPWPRPEEELLAGVSAFGFGGTNAHLVLSQP